MTITCPFYKGSVSGPGTGPLDPESMDPVPDLETQSLEVWYQISSQPYEDCLEVREYIVSYNTVVIFLQYFDNIIRSVTVSNLLLFVLVIYTE